MLTPFAEKVRRKGSAIDRKPSFRDGSTSTESKYVRRKADDVTFKEEAKRKGSKVDNVQSTSNLSGSTASS